MAHYLGFLRAINLGATRKFPKGDIVRVVESVGFTDVETYINTGNIRFSTSMRSRSKIEATLEEAFEADRGFAVPTMVYTPDEIRAIAEHAAALDHDGMHYVSLLKDEPTAAGLAAVRAAARDGELAEVGGRAIHLMLGVEYHTAKLTNTLVERHLGVATNRNLTVIRAVVERWT